VVGQQGQLKRIEEMAGDVARAHRAEASFSLMKAYPPTVHDREMTDLGARVAEKLLGAEKVVWVEEPTMGGEDFSYFLQQIPGTFFRLGTARGSPEEEPALHSDRFDFNDEALVDGMTLMAGVALEYLK
jgi:amidohydrolase